VAGYTLKSAGEDAAKQVVYLNHASEALKEQVKLAKSRPQVRLEIVCGPDCGGPMRSPQHTVQIGPSKNLVDGKPGRNDFRDEWVLHLCIWVLMAQWVAIFPLKLRHVCIDERFRQGASPDH
jgi:hypothetical protein